LLAQNSANGDKWLALRDLDQIYRAIDREITIREMLIGAAKIDYEQLFKVASSRRFIRKRDASLGQMSGRAPPYANWTPFATLRGHPF
jgi:hypothetical protein